MHVLRCLLPCLLIGLDSASGIATAAEPLHWYRGNTHVHGVVEGYAPDTISDWYSSHGFDFIVSTEHERVLALSEFRHLPKHFLVIPGQEITEIVRDRSHPDGVRHLHVNALGTQEVIQPARKPAPAGVTANTPAEFRALLEKTAPELAPVTAYQRHLAAVRAQGGVPQVNHPNLNWSVRAEDLLPLEGPYLLEVANSFPFANNRGGSMASGDSAPATEALWDRLLSAGRIVWAVASDDAHDYTHFDKRHALTPGHGWIVARAATLDRESILQALRSGAFYASTGIGIDDIRSDGRQLQITIAPTAGLDPPLPVAPDSRFVTRFIGRDGRELARAYGRTPAYRFHGDETYVRAEITDSDGRQAWLQPVFLDGRDKPRRP